MTDYTKLSNEALSAEVARRLFGLVPCENTAHLPGHWLESEVCFSPADKPNIGGPDGHYTTPYASDHNAALGLVVPEMRKRGYGFELIGFAEGIMTATFVKLPWPTTKLAFSASAKDGDEPRAICEAALAALDQEGKS